MGKGLIAAARKRRGAQCSPSPARSADLNSTKCRRAMTALEAETLLKITDILKNDPDRIFEEYCRLTSQSSIVQKNDSANWNGTYVYWRSISKAWLSNLIVELASPYGLTSALLESIDETNAEVVRQMCLLFFGVRPEEKFPRACICKLTMKEYLTRRAKVLGDRYKTFLESGAVNRDNSLNLAKACPYKLSFVDGKVASISHKTLGENGTEAIVHMVNMSIVIDDKWDLIDPLDDRAASVKQSWFQPLLKDFFKAEHATTSFWDLWDELANNQLANNLRAEVMKGSETLQVLDKTALLKGEEKRMQERREKARARSSGPRTPLKCALVIGDQVEPHLAGLADGSSGGLARDLTKGTEDEEEEDGNQEGR